MELELRILGSNSALPLTNRHASAQFFTLANRHFLIDCSEGTQMQLRKNKVGFGRLQHILISHLHGDHFYGLVPLLTSLHLLDRHKPLDIYGPPDLEKAVYDLLKISGARLRFSLRFHPLGDKACDLIYEDQALKVFAFPVAHSLPCWGFFFQEKPRPRKFRPEIGEKYNIPVTEIRQIKAGKDWQDAEGHWHANEELTTDPPPPLSYCYLTDSLPLPQLTEVLPGPPDVLYHEATFGEAFRKRAHKTKHSTARQAAEVARALGAKYLLIGHFSVRYDEFQDLRDEARAVFPQTFLALENARFYLKSGLSLCIEEAAD